MSLTLIIILLVIVLVASSFMRTVPQATVAVVTVFGKYRRIMRAGLNFKLPWENIAHRLSLQNRALQRTIDGSIRQFVATTKQSDILGMRAEIVDSMARVVSSKNPLAAASPA